MNISDDKIVRFLFILNLWMLNTMGIHTAMAWFLRSDG